MTDFLNEVGTTEVARDSLKMEVNKPASWSAHDLRTRPVIPSGPRLSWCLLLLLSSLRTSSSDTVVTWSNITALSAAFLTCWSAESRRHYIQSGRRRCFKLFGQQWICSQPRQMSYFPEEQMVFSPATCVGVIELKIWLNSLPVSEFSSSNCPSESIARCFVLAHVSWQKTGVVCGSALVNRSTDCSVHPRFLIWECPYCYRFSGIFSGMRGCANANQNASFLTRMKGGFSLNKRLGAGL